MGMFYSQVYYLFNFNIPGQQRSEDDEEEGEVDEDEEETAKKSSEDVEVKDGDGEVAALKPDGVQVKQHWRLEKKRDERWVLITDQ